MFRTLLGCSVALIVFLNFGHTTALSGAIQATGATQVNKADIDATVDAAPEGRVSDQQIRMVDAGGHNVGIGIVHRPATNNSSGIVGRVGRAVLHNCCRSGADGCCYCCTGPTKN